jgi:thiol-disulfide isomerase/thioredoxin
VTLRNPRRAAAAAAGALALALVSGACTSDPNSVAAQAMAGDGKGYVAGDGTVEQLPAAGRSDAVTLAGTTVDGTPWSAATDAAGKVVVVNVWGSWCAPCVDETPHLQQVSESYRGAGKPVAFVGIDIKESAATAAAFLRANGVGYPSLSDSASGGRPMLALQGKASATPTTLVLDRKGRIAARVLGATTVGTLTALVDDVLAEPA